MQCCWDCGPSPPPFELTRGLARLTVEKFITCHLVNLHPSLNPTCPVYRHSVGDPIPEHKLLREISHALSSRWDKTRVPTELYVPTKRAANWFGSTAFGLPSLKKRDHDLLLTDVFCLYRSRSPAIAKRWIGEHLLPKAGFRVKDPDAFLVENGERYRIVESGGAYGRSQCESLICHAAERSLELEIW